MKYCSMLRNRMLADPSFLFKVGTEIVIDSYCATFAEVQKRGKDFWAEFELYAADLLVGIAIDIALVSMLAPNARIWKAISITRIIWRGILLSLVFFATGADKTMLISDAGKVYAFGKDLRWF
ncbi:PREDICTED: protein RETICULATA-RELATED 1, chloroplastic-like [Prunus mume]|uniref:Protein RETICULATA-RELATED 1, chloroplastic-like n=1 Tax=Prunus mume TaxID=102107 RepID=A0ABM0NSR6_PRUMU|nr:PREDICTED: protein RETICULATA-RELATED 1, chloroplastic-like [Prunus mume]XP_016649192.1 PREDICTED: protein RETICULATA-RELATED 1, chloroplastic-like [Prunus mume]XP_016649193.1 PREDICTED: protein RETICULATA-RELATED 1, chloroplastic-like [Prunus mume]